MRRIRFVVTGRVQGVGFRAHAAARGDRLGLVGFVQNRLDGAVEGQAQGPPAGVAAFAGWLRTGPPSARVESVEVEDLPPCEGEGSFEVRRG